ncbi:META domain-containing protein [Pontibacter ramchanderi]|uniref:META domain-containing protein n=1 Tax=Pontibacter ramchanderi TaxID=1179743 RepID=A0A2N3U8H4_9BACT|nr:META domain-containing protein [Pontibacter ramchanderi]PKV63051.1 META domain-containing protein [Pontibacter ramchanderi]
MKNILHTTLFLLVLICLGACNLSKKNRQYGVEGDTELQSSYWVLLSLQDQQFKDNPETQTAYIRFEVDGNELTGFTGCNRLMGRYSLNNGSLQLTNLATTRAMCPIIEQENLLMAVLEKADSYEIAGDVLTLFHQKTAVATFRTSSEPNLPTMR